MSTRHIHMAVGNFTAIASHVQYVGHVSHCQCFMPCPQSPSNSLSIIPHHFHFFSHKPASPNVFLYTNAIRARWFLLKLPLSQLLKVCEHVALRQNNLGLGCDPIFILICRTRFGYGISKIWPYYRTALSRQGTVFSLLSLATWCHSVSILLAQ